MTVQQGDIFTSEQNDEKLARALETLDALGEPAPGPIEIIAAEVEEFRRTVPSSLIIQNEDQFYNSDALLKTAKRIATHAEDIRKDLVAPLNGEVKRINETFRAITAPLLELEQTVKGALLEFRREQQRIADEARRKAEADRKRKEDELREQAAAASRAAEAERLEAERKRREAEELEGRERAAMLRSAAAAEARADKQENAATESAFLATAVASVPVEAKLPPKAAGSSVSVTFKAAITDKAAFLRWALETNNLHFVEINVGTLDKMAAATKGQQEWPGVEVKPVETMRSSRR